MGTAPIPKPEFSALWRSVVDDLEAALARVASEAAARERESPALDLPDPDRLTGLAEQLAPSDAWLEPLRDAVRKAEQLVADTNAALEAEEAALRNWSAAVAESRQRLADWESRNAHRPGHIISPG